MKHRSKRTMFIHFTLKTVGVRASRQKELRVKILTGLACLMLLTSSGDSGVNLCHHSLNKKQRLLLLSNSLFFVFSVALPLIMAGQHALCYKGEYNAAKSQLGKPLPVFASLCTHINCGDQLLSLISTVHSTVAHLRPSTITPTTPPPNHHHLLVIHKVPTVVIIKRCDNITLKTLNPSADSKPMASGASHDTSVLQ